MQDKVENSAAVGSSAESKIPKPRGKIIPVLIVFAIVLYILAIFGIILMDSKIVWMPQDVVMSVVSDVQYYRANPAESVGASSNSELPVEGFVESQFIPALNLINDNPQFKYLADLVVQYKIPIVAEQGVVGNSLYTSSCPVNPIGKLSVNPSFADANTDVLAGILVHELTHAYDRINQSSKYCTGTHYISDELNTRRNQYSFWYLYDHALFFGIYTMGMIDIRGNVNDYCIYQQIKKTDVYSDWTDDVNLSPSPGSNEGTVCSIASLL